VENAQPAAIATHKMILFMVSPFKGTGGSAMITRARTGFQSGRIMRGSGNGFRRAAIPLPAKLGRQKWAALPVLEISIGENATPVTDMSAAVREGSCPGSQIAVRREPSRVAFISIAERSTFRAVPHVQSEERVDMRAHRVFLSFAIAMGCGITLQGLAFSQEYRGTWEQQMACTPDVWRLCGAQVPDVERIVACLRRNTPQLSGRCRAVFEQGDNAPTRGEESDYGQRRYDRDYGPKRYDYDDE
jgi:hypothetical protein